MGEANPELPKTWQSRRGYFDVDRTCVEEEYWEAPCQLLSVRVDRDCRTDMQQKWGINNKRVLCCRSKEKPSFASQCTTSNQSTRFFSFFGGEKFVVYLLPKNLNKAECDRQQKWEKHSHRQLGEVSKGPRSELYGCKKNGTQKDENLRSLKSKNKIYSSIAK